MNDKIKNAAELIQNSNHTTAFSGAGISVESGIPPFRGENGLWNKYNPSVLDLSRFYDNPTESWKIIKEIFYDFFGNVEPNKAHTVLAKMEKHNLVHSVITQNIDYLHQKAGSKAVWEFHGTSQELICISCGKKYPVADTDLSTLPPKCNCGGILKPNFIFFGEGIPPDAYAKSMEDAKHADVFIVIGTTGEIMPASFIPEEAKANGVKIIEVNTRPSNFTNRITDIYLEGKATEIFAELEKHLFT